MIMRRDLNAAQLKLIMRVRRPRIVMLMVPE